MFFFLSSEVGLSVTITNDGLLEDALIKPHEPSSNENLTPLIVNTSLIIWPSILILFFLIYWTFLTNSLTICYFSSSLQKGAIVGDW